MRKHAFYYVGLLACIAAAVILVREYPFNKQMQMEVVVALGGFYVIWGVIHHKLHHSLRIKIMLEYIVVASLGIAAILFILKSVL